MDLPSFVPDYVELVDDPNNLNVLLMGKHGSNVDTMIFAHVDSVDGKVVLVSIPRDLYYQNRKINSIYAGKGVLAQLAAVEDVVGYKIQHYALVDMYVFRDIVNELGGIDVTLKEDLIDPTYKVCDGDVCSTLYYEAGLHHLDGTEALRVARSRHTTSDYSRAERQQLILQGIQDKFRSLGVEDAATLFDLMTTILGALETDITLAQATQYVLKYQNYEIDGGNVISTVNVLSAVPVPVDYVTSHPIRICEDETKPETCKDTFAIDTLQPKNSNWNLMRWYVSGLLEE
ncbi:LCP family protein [Candidatus Peregrinibacteria bacterium]|nr:MAG: LCP family protein [Candidatus Peregrinibacteria bacterium]